jgi:selenium metabolism protein YedF
MMRRVLVLNSDTMGKGDEELGRRLMVKFVHQLAGLPTLPDGVLFYNTAVRLLANDSVVVEALRELERGGVELLACGTCVEHFKLGNSLGAGHVTDMREIAATLVTADHVAGV